jgi:hypothetical protein
MTSARASECWIALCAFAWWAGCAADTGDKQTMMDGMSCIPGSIGCNAITGSGGIVGAAPGTGGTTSIGTGGTTSIGTGGTTSTPVVSENVPCGVAQVVSTNCTGCHGMKLNFGAPMALMKASDFQAMGKLDAAHKVYEIANTRINSTDTNLKMPPVSIEKRPTATDVQTLTTWLTAGAMPAATGGCAITQGTIDMGMMNADAGMMPGTHMGGASITKIEYDDPEMKCYKFITHANGDAAQPFSVGTTPDMYTNFTFAAPWTGMQYARSFDIITGNSEVIHHWLFFRNTGPEPDLAVSPGSGTHPDGILLHGWAPSASPMYMDPDVGQEMPDDVGYTLETHHNNTTGAAAPDSSGVEVCVTPKVPEHIATISWLGSDSIAGTSASGTCDPSSNDEIHLIAAQPHMHLKGQHMKVVLNRAAGGTEIVHDADFSFDYQRYYVFDFVMKPGDTLDTTCTYSAPATFGQSTQNEMCYFFTLAWPPLALTSPNFASSAIHGQNTCM